MRGHPPSPANGPNGSRALFKLGGLRFPMCRTVQGCEVVQAGGQRGWSGPRAVSQIAKARVQSGSACNRGLRSSLRRLADRLQERLPLAGLGRSPTGRLVDGRRVDPQDGRQGAARAPEALHPEVRDPGPGTRHGGQSPVRGGRCCLRELTFDPRWPRTAAAIRGTIRRSPASPAGAGES